MNWLEEVRVELGGLNVSVDSVEMSEAVLVKFGSLYLWLTSERSMTLETRGVGIITRALRSTLELIEDRLAARGWVRS